ncbi:hypothetical protein CC80DRAFT_555427 [Byssothecium circinans]|uniref:Uncharacterized protein n=1 Tax=Byssothecium circinans TaxID=147558 RepID=A0A6A5TK96_9PLEO|nr:hypothetical protein CC80DRAFT_555427 [Byssothecium circinans]
MTLFTNPRSSDSIHDFEHAATLQDLRELTMSEKEYVSPQESHTVPLIFPERSPSSNTSRSISRATSRASQRSLRAQASQQQPTEKLVNFTGHVEAKAQQTMNEKLAVFRDDIEEAAPRATIEDVSTLKSVPTRKRGKVGLQARAKSDPALRRALSEVSNTGKRGEDGNIPHGEEGFREAHNIPSHAVMSSPAPGLINQLRQISDERFQLLQRLQALDQQESGIISLLSHPVSPVKPLYTRALNDENEIVVPPAPTPFLPQSRPDDMTIDTNDMLVHPPARTLSPLKLTKTSRKTKQQIPRPISAPPKSTPSGSRQRTPSATKRVPLTDCTIFSIFDWELMELPISPLSGSGMSN